MKAESIEVVELTARQQRLSQFSDLFRQIQQLSTDSEVRRLALLGRLTAELAFEETLYDII